MKRHNRPGTAMSEFLLVLPLLVVVLALVVFLGRGMVRAQRVAVLDRYEAWRQAGGSVANAPAAAYPRVPQADAPSANSELNQAFLGNHADSLAYAGDSDFPSDAPQQLLGAITDSDAARLAERELASRAKGRRVSVSAGYSSNIPLWAPLEHPLTHTHTRIGHDWAYVNDWRRPQQVGNSASVSAQWDHYGNVCSNQPIICDVFFSSFDNQLTALPCANSSLVRVLRRIYTDDVGYVGPTMR